MENILLAVHVLAGILFVGPVAVTTSLFPRFAFAARGDAGAGPGLAIAGVLHRITRVYGILALVVPIVGLALAAVQYRLGEIWITVAMVLTAVAGGLLALRIVPAQREALAAPVGGRSSGRSRSTLALLTGLFNVLWAVVVVLMIVRPGAE